jgi:antitoxin YefM
MIRLGGRSTVVTANYTEARNNLAKLWDQVIENREVVRLHRRGAADIALIAADELDSILETAYLLRSPANAARLNAAMDEALARTNEPITLDELRREVGIAEEVSTDK